MIAQTLPRPAAPAAMPSVLDRILPPAPANDTAVTGRSVIVRRRERARRRDAR